MIKRNEKQNLDRKFKDIAVGDRIFLKNNIRRHKFVQKYAGPFRVIALKGSTVFCYSLANKKHKQVTMDKVRYAGDLSQDDAPDLLHAYPEEEPIVDDEIFDSNQGPDHPNIGKQTRAPVLPTETVVPTKSRAPVLPTKTVVPTQFRGPGKLQHRQNMPTNKYTTHRYSLRNR